MLPVFGFGDFSLPMPKRFANSLRFFMEILALMVKISLKMEIQNYLTKTRTECAVLVYATIILSYWKKKLSGPMRGQSPSLWTAFSSILCFFLLTTTVDAWRDEICFVSPETVFRALNNLTQWIDGRGMPSASHSRVAFSPSRTSMYVDAEVDLTEGGTQTSR